MAEPTDDEILEPMSDDDASSTADETPIIPEKTDTDEPFQFDPFSDTEENVQISHLPGMFRNWFLDYASYVILERAIPHINDGLKPVQRRILHSMRRLEDGRYNKVANIIGHSMQFHPHGDRSINDALVQMGQKDLLIDCQGNWGNILTGDGAAAPRYIEARLSKIALDIVFSPKVTNWKLSYDGRNKEPVTLPVKYPILLMHGVEGIAVGLQSKILPHNFNELIDASIAHLKGQDFTLLPDFPTGGLVDASKYKDGARGGSVRVRAKISVFDKKTLIITELPFGRDTDSLIASIIKANDKGKIKIRKIDDNTAENVEILLHLQPGVFPDKTIDALYAFTDCEYSISVNCCVIESDKPHFISVKDVLRHSAQNTVNILRRELEIQRDELEDDWHFASLEKIFIENEIYELIKTCKTEESILQTIDEGLKPFVKILKRAVVRDDLVRLSNLPIKRISKFSSFQADEFIKSLEEKIKEINKKLDTIVEVAIEYYKEIKKKYGKGRDRRTEIRNFETIAAVEVAEANQKLYANFAEGFIGVDLKKDQYICDCSDIDDILCFMSDGTYKIVKVDSKVFVGKDIIYASVFKKNDTRTVYNIIYRDGLNGVIMVKRATITGLMRDKDYDITKGTPQSKILHFSANLNGETEVVKIKLIPKPRIQKLTFEYDFGTLAVKGRNSMGNQLTHHAIHKIEVLGKSAGSKAGFQRWFDMETLRLNEDERGIYLGEFSDKDKILVVSKRGEYRLTNFDLLNHYDDDDVLLIEKYKSNKIFSAVFWDGEQAAYYLKRFIFEDTIVSQGFINEHEKSKLTLLSGHRFPQILLDYGGGKNDNDIIDADAFIAVKGYKARGKKLTVKKTKRIVELQPLEKEIPIEETTPIEETSIEPKQETELPKIDLGKNDKGEQMTLF